MRLRILTDLFRQEFVCKTLKYTKYSCGFTPFSDEKSLVRLSCRFMRYCLKAADTLSTSARYYDLKTIIQDKKDPNSKNAKFYEIYFYK